MGDNEMTRREDLRAIAMEVLKKAGAVRECDRHLGIFIDKGDRDAEKQAYAIGTNMVKKGEVEGSREEFMAAIESALEMAVDRCPQCPKISDE
jgi:hypothetical protein